MCGIVGIYYFDHRKKVNREDIKLMMNQIIHRGPDDEGDYVDGNVALGMRRLSIIDVGGGHQPIFSEDNSKVIVFNGEVYNFNDHYSYLIQKGHSIKTRTDTEIVLHLYEEFRTDCFSKMNGMFGLAIWDESEKRLIIARDRIGIKPLYYLQDEEKIIFSSEIKSILALSYIHPEIDYTGLALYFKHGFTPAPYSLYKKIKKVLPGHYLNIIDNKVSIHQYWNISYSQKFNFSEVKFEEEIYNLLKDSVRYRLIADVPLGAFLSGGMDSSGIVHLMQKIREGTTKTYSIGFGKGYEFYNELDTANQFAKDHNTNHHEILVEPNVVELFPKLIKYLDEPLADSSFIVTYLVSKLASEEVKVILSGVGGDELFGGYRRYLNIRLNAVFSNLPKWLSEKILLKVTNKLPIDRNNSLLNYFRLAKGYLNSAHLESYDQYGTYASVFNDEFLSELLGKNNIPDYYKLYFDECDSDDLLDKMMYFDLKTSLPEQLLLLTDKMSMATSLEARVPFLDHRLVEFAAKVPTKFKIKGFKLRYIQKKAFENKLPAYVLKKKKKGFGAPFGIWVRNELKQMVNDLLSNSEIKKQAIFNPIVIQNILKDHYNYKQDYTDQLLCLVMFQLWYHHNFNGS